MGFANTPGSEGRQSQCPPGQVLAVMGLLPARGNQQLLQAQLHESLLKPPKPNYLLSFQMLCLLTWSVYFSHIGSQP